MSDFLHSTLGRTGRPVFRLGLSGAYWPGEAALRSGIDAGMNYLFWYYWDRQMTRVLRSVLPANREKFTVATGVCNYAWAVRRGVDASLRKLNTEYLDVFHVFWVGAGGLRPGVLDLLERYKQEGKIRAIAVSTHHRPLAAQLVKQGVLDVLMMRYNAAHRGAEVEIFPHLAASQPGVVSYTATRWRTLLGRPRPTAGDCYRFVLSNPNVDACLMAPTNRAQLDQNLAALAQGPLAAEEMEFMRRFGAEVRQRRFLGRKT